MKPVPFAYHRPASLDEALALLERYGADGRVLAGGQSLVPALNMRLATPAALIDINRLPGLDGISLEPEGLVIGALARHEAVEASPLVARHAPLIAAGDAPRGPPGDPDSRHRRRQRRARRSRRRAAGLSRRARRDRPRGRAREPARHSGTALLPRHLHDGPRAGRDRDGRRGAAHRTGLALALRRAGPAPRRLRAGRPCRPLPRRGRRHQGGAAGVLRRRPDACPRLARRGRALRAAVPTPTCWRRPGARSTPISTLRAMSTRSPALRRHLARVLLARAVAQIVA